MPRKKGSLNKKTLNGIPVKQFKSLTIVGISEDIEAIKKSAKEAKLSCSKYMMTLFKEKGNEKK